MILAHPVPARYRLPLLGSPDPLLRRALLVSGALGVVWLALVWLAPAPSVHEATVEDLPERFARLIVEEPKPPAPAPSSPAPRAVAETPPAPTPEAAPPTPKVETPKVDTPRRSVRAPEPKIAADRGQAGREQARTQVTQQLEQVSADVNQTLESLASVLPATTSGETAAAPARRGGRAPRAGRGERAVGSAQTRTTTGGAALSGTELAADATDLGALGSFDLAGVSGSSATPSGSGSEASGGGGSGDRSASSLMAVVRRYAPGIRYCYDTALESDRSLRGKMVFRITVGSAGDVTAVEVIEDSLGSAEVRRCALAQIEAWRFGAASSASVFNAPFVFRPTE